MKKCSRLHAQSSLDELTISNRRWELSQVVGSRQQAWQRMRQPISEWNWRGRGAGGKAIDGVSYANITAAGDVRGGQVN
jgi:hypothetical protein